MKTIILKSLAFILAVTAISCSNDNDATTDGVLYNEAEASKNIPLKDGGDMWDGPIGEIRGSSPVITADEAAIIAQFEDISSKLGNPITIVSLSIVEKVAINDPNDRAYFLLAKASNNTTQGMMLEQASGGFFMLDRTQGRKLTGCRGCTYGCDLEYYYVGGKRVPYCNENGCVYDCDKIQIEI